MSETTNVIKSRNPNRTTEKLPKKPIPDIEWNDKSIKAFTDIGLEPPEHLGQFMRTFLATVDVSKAPINSTVTSMVRLKAADYLGQEKNKLKVPERKEFLYYTVRFEGVDWRGVAVNPVDNIEGYYTKQFLKPHISPKDGSIDYEELDTSKAQTVYYIPFSKKAVDDIISKSAKSDKDTGIIYTIKFASEDLTFAPGRMPTRCQYQYEQFANWKWDDIYKQHVKPHEQAATEYMNKDKTAHNMTFEPT